MPKITKLTSDRINVNIDNYPALNLCATDQVIEVTEGDLHANFLRVLFTCTRYGIIKLSSQVYEQLVALYYQQEKSNLELVKLDIVLFEELLNKIKIVPSTKITLRLLGDELCDRGRNDYFILKFIVLLQKAGVKLEIIESNHGLEAMLAYENYETHDHCFKSSTLSGPLPISHAFSLDAMEQSLKEGIIKKETVDELYQVYIKSRKLISYTLNEEKNELILFSHAPIDLKTIESAIKKAHELTEEIKTSEQTVKSLLQQIESKKHTLVENEFKLESKSKGYQEALKESQEKLNKAEKYKQFKQQFPEQFENIKAIPIVYNDKTAVELALSIDVLNQIYRTFLLTGNLHLLYSPDILAEFYRQPDENASSSKEGCDIDLLNEYPFEFMSWNRYYKQLVRDFERDNYKVTYCHGHDSTSQTTAKHIINLDNNLGKYKFSTKDEYSKGMYRILYSEGYGPLKKEQTFPFFNNIEKPLASPENEDFNAKSYLNSK